MMQLLLLSFYQRVIKNLYDTVQVSRLWNRRQQRCAEMFLRAHCWLIFSVSQEISQESKIRCDFSILFLKKVYIVASSCNEGRTFTLGTARAVSWLLLQKISSFLKRERSEEYYIMFQIRDHTYHTSYSTRTDSPALFSCPCSARLCVQECLINHPMLAS
jgi:hypothetical protein